MPRAKKSRPTVTLRFKSEAAKDYFLGQLSDGWGENVVSLNWPWGNGVDLKDAAVIDVSVYSMHEDGKEVVTEDDARPYRKKFRGRQPE